jgi:glycosyltransferase involved in cell wall biosynthesis
MVSVIVPLFNEEKNLRLLFEKIHSTLSKQVWDFEVIFINDGSTDDSASVLDSLQKDYPDIVRSIHLLRNYGQTAAMSAGIDESKYCIIVPMDADLQNDPNDIPALVEKLQDGYDVVSGWRKDRKDSPIKRNLLSNIANYLIRKISKVEIHDLGCSLKAYRKEFIADIHLYGEMHRFIPIYAKWNGATRITEMPVKHKPREHGESKYGLNRILKVILDLTVVIFLHKYGQKPIYVFGTFGFINLSCSFFCSCGAIYYKFFSQTYKSFIQTPLPLLAVMFFVVGILCILLGLLAELSIRTYYESQNKKTYKIRNRNSTP